MTQTYKIIGGDRKEYGPVTAGELRNWLAEGRLNAQSLARAEDSAEWKPLAAYPEFAHALGLSPATPPPLTGGVTGSTTAGRPFVPGEVKLHPGGCLARSGRLLLDNFGLFAGATLVVWLLSLLELIPVLGLVYKVGWGVLYGGFYLLILKRIRGQAATVGDVFAGFKLSAGQLVLAGFISSLLAGIGTLFCFIPGLYLTVAWVFCVPLVADKGLEFWSAMELSRKTVNRIWFRMVALLLVAFLPLLVVKVVVGVKIGSLMFNAIHEAMASGQFNFQQFMDSMQQFTGMSLKLDLLSKVVLLFNLPFGAGALLYAYEDIFGARRPASA